MPELDVRSLRRPDRHPTVFASYDALAVGESLVLVNDHDPRHLRDEFEVDHPGSHGWEYLGQGPAVWRVRISKRASTPLPRVLTGTTGSASDEAGVQWTLPMRDRDLDANVVRLSPGGTIDTHTGPDLDVLLHVLHGTGRITTELDTVELSPGDLVWLPRRSRRQFTAGPDGLHYLTVHRRRQALVLDTARASR